MADFKTQGVSDPTFCDRECERLLPLLADQIDRGAFTEARETVALILFLKPNDPDALDVVAFLNEQLDLGDPNSSGEIRRFEGHKAWVNCVAFSPDGSQVLSASGGLLASGEFREGEDLTLRLWDVESGKELRRFKGHSTIINTAAFTPDGLRIISGTRGGSMTLWKGDSGRTLQPFERRTKSVWSIAVSPDGQSVLSGCDDRVIRLWSVKTGKRLRKLEGHQRGVTSVQFAGNGRLALSGSFDNTLRSWDVETGTELGHFEGHTQAVLSVALSRDGKVALSGSSDQTLRLWDVQSGRELRCFTGHTQAVNSVALSPEGRWGLSGSSDHTLRLWDLGSGRELHCYRGHTDAVMTVAISPDGRRAVSGSRDGSIRLWQLPGPPLEVRVLESVPELVKEIRRCQLLDPMKMNHFTGQLQHLFPDARTLALKLLEKGWLTSFQVNHLMHFRGYELTLNSCLLLERLGEGGMGQVFRAHDLTTGQVVALKLIRPELLAHPIAVEKFRWEITALSRLAHPNIIKTFEARPAGSRLYFTMELLQGIELRKLIQRGPLPVPLACDYARQAALGLEHAHEHCLIHRDIKPANLFLTESPEGRGVIKIIDWGLAGLRLPPGGTRPDHVPPAREDVIGTLDYLAPEQATEPLSADIRADVYSLGCTLYHLLTGQPPFPHGTFMEKWQQHQQAEPVSVALLRPEVPPDLAAVLHKMMAKNPEDRYRTPALVAVALTPFCK